QGCRWQLLQNELYGLYQYRRGTGPFSICLRPFVKEKIVFGCPDQGPIPFCYLIDRSGPVRASLCEKQGHCPAFLLGPQGMDPLDALLRHGQDKNTKIEMPPIPGPLIFPRPKKIQFQWPSMEPRPEPWQKKSRSNKIRSQLEQKLTGKVCHGDAKDQTSFNLRNYTKGHIVYPMAENKSSAKFKIMLWTLGIVILVGTIAQSIFAHKVKKALEEEVPQN